MSELIAKKASAVAEDSDSDDEVEQHVAEEVAEVEIDDKLSNSDVVTKYQEAAKIANAALTLVISLCVPGAKMVDICKAGDDFIEARTAAIFNKKVNGSPILKGIAFPTCVSVNHIISHCSPLESDDSWEPLTGGDMCKIDLGVHVDGFIAVVAHTIVVPGDVQPDSAARTNVASAAWMAAEVAVKLIKAGNTNTQVTAAIKKVADAYGVKPCTNFEMLQMKKFVIDGNKKIALREPGPDSPKSEVCTFEPLEVYGIDVVMSTGEGVPRETGARTTVYKRCVGVKYSLKNQSSRQYFNEVNKRFPTLPFSNRAFPDEKAAKMGVRECVVHGLLQPFTVSTEKPDALVAHVKCTVLLMPNGKTLQITGLPPSEVLVPAAAGVPVTLAGLRGLGRTLAEGLTADALDAELLATVQEVPESSADKKKAKKAAAAAAAAAAK